MTFPFQFVALVAFAFATGYYASEAWSQKSTEYAKTTGARAIGPRRNIFILAFLAFCAAGNLLTLGPFGYPLIKSLKDISSVQNGQEWMGNESFEVAQYEFPTVDERFKYYMGDFWYNKTDWTLGEANCSLLRSKVLDVDVIMTLKELNQCSKSDTTNMMKYCDDAYDTLRRASKRLPRVAMFHFGDGHTHFGDGQSEVHSLPAISKSRFAKSVTTGPPPIIWPLNMNRHYSGVRRYHDQFMAKWEWVPWEKKMPAVIWRGKPTGNRIEQLKQWFDYDPNVVDVALSDVKEKEEERLRDMNITKEKAVRGNVDMGDMARYKYLLSVEGNDVATGLKWMLYSNSVVMMAPPTKVSWAMEDLLLPFVHYIPLSNDLSNLLEMIAWAEQHQEACRQISSRAMEYVERLWMSQKARVDNARLKKKLATAYVKQFHKPLSRCTKKKK